MKFLKLFEHFVSEKNKVASYYEKHPEAIKKFGISGKDEEDFDNYIARSYDNDNPLKDKVESVKKELKTKFEEATKDIKFTDSNDDRYNNLWSKIFNEDAMFSKYYLQEKPTKEKMLADCKTGRFTYSKEQVTPEAIEFLEKNWESILDVLKKKHQMNDLSKNWSEKRLEKEAIMKGVDKRDYIAAMSWINYFTGMSRRKLPKEIWPALRAITVEENELPKVVYRGLFFDGAKIKDKEKFLQKWKEGSKPGVSLVKATSWSASKAVAADFMQDQDFIKDRDNGYFMLLKWNVDPKHVVADLRNIDGKFWNQQEVIVDSDVKDYQVEKLIKYEPYNKDKPREIENYQNSNHASNAGAFGRTKNEIMSDILNLFDADVRKQYKMEWKELKDLTLGEVEKKMKFKYSGNWTSMENDGDDRKFLFSMIAGLKRLSWNLPYAVYPTKFISPTKADVNFSVKCDFNKTYSHSILRDFVFDKLGIVVPEKDGKFSDIKEIDLPYDFSIEGSGSCELVQNNIMMFKYDVVLPKKYDIDSSSLKKFNTKITDVQQNNIDRVLKTINDNISEVNKILAKLGKERFEQENVKINIK